MKRIDSFLLRGATCAALLALLAACGGHSSTSSAAPVQPQAVKGVQTPSQISVVTAK